VGVDCWTETRVIETEIDPRHRDREREPSPWRSATHTQGAAESRATKLN
jgi:hypothetical protein